MVFVALSRSQVTYPWKGSGPCRLGADGRPELQPRVLAVSPDVPLGGLRAAGASAHLLPLLPEAHRRLQPLTSTLRTTAPSRLPCSQLGY